MSYWNNQDAGTTYYTVPYQYLNFPYQNTANGSVTGCGTGSTIFGQYMDNGTTAAFQLNMNTQVDFVNCLINFNFIDDKRGPVEKFFNGLDLELAEILLKEKHERLSGVGKELLRQFLSDSEFAALYDTEGVWLDSEIHKDRKYLVNLNGEIRVFEKGSDIGYLCVHTKDSFIHEDVLLSYLVGLEFDEEKFLKVANLHHAPRKVCPLCVT